jgi:hypothetical protein
MDKTSDQILQMKIRQVELLEKKLEIQKLLPHKYALPRYKWQKAYEEAKFIKKRLICAANQIGKSTIQICDRIEIATNPELWSDLWPAQFQVNPDTKPYSWYLYPNQDTVMTEFREKWVPYYMPKDKDHPVYGWKEVIVNKVLKYVEFKTGYKIYFKTYNQNVQDLQSGTVFAIDCDEELPERMISELMARLFASDGFFSMAFTATLGQEFWYKVIERIGEPDEMWRDAYKVQVSMYDCLEYEDGSLTPWTKERLRRVENNCKSKNEIQRRVYGRFVKDSGLAYPGFDRDKNYVPFPKKGGGKRLKHPPRGWHVYSGVDVGSGGSDNHPAAYSFLMVNEKFSKIRWFRGSRLDGIETSAGDIYRYYKRSEGKLNVSGRAYDYSSKEFGIVVNRAGMPFEKADKKRELSSDILNTILKTGMLKIYYDPDDPEDEAIKLVRELETLPLGADKTKAKDDFIDSLRYALMQIPLDWDKILNGEDIIIPKEVKPGSPEDKRSADYIWESEHDRKRDEESIEEEIEEWFGDEF